ncbi:MAG: M1 family metallopeptidase, partial [Promethearchaeota archaeon]
NKNKEHLNEYPILATNEGEYSSFNLSVTLDEVTSTIEGNLCVDFFNNDPVNFTKIPFHIYLSGMNYTSRPGKIDILSVNKTDILKTPLRYDVNPANQSMWVFLNATLEPFQRIQFKIHFNATLPDGGIDRSNSHGNDIDQSRIFKCTSFYPIPCVYDSYDGWNIDPYLQTGDPFYLDMAYYDFYVRVPNGMIVAATGELVQKIKDGSFTTHHFNPLHPVREVTFSASRYFLRDSIIVNRVNVSSFYLPKSQVIWEDNANFYASRALSLFNESYGEYPYPTLNIVEEYTIYGGMEYPCQVYITEAIDRWSTKQYYLELIIVHEVAHQWWYNLVGNDEVDWGFLDEGLASWSESYYSEIFYGNWSYFQITPWLFEVRYFNAIWDLPAKINASVYEFLYDINYYFTGYTKAPLIFEKLRKTVGNATFLTGVKLFYGQFVNRTALLSDFQLAMEVVYGDDLDWFFFPWFDNSYLPKYEISTCIYNVTESSLYITITDLNEPLNQYGYSQQVPLIIFDSKNNIISSDWILINHTTNMIFHFDWALGQDRKPYKVRLDYDNDVLVQLDFSDLLFIESQVELINGEKGLTWIQVFNFTTIAIIYSVYIVLIIRKSLTSKKTSKSR